MAKAKVLDWRKDKIKVKVVNLESPGSDIFAELNGVKYLIQHGVTIDLPKAIVNILNQTSVNITEISGNLDKGGTVKVVSTSERIFVTEVGEADKEDEVDTVLDQLNDNEDID